jgi:peptidoglycan/LPS O-acetylase OafA/YrhL
MHESQLREPRLAVDIESAERSQNLDILRALAALSVVAVHSYGLGVQSADDVTLEFSRRATLGQVGVWLFFALSGYLITGPFIRSLMSGAPLPGFREYATRRVFRIFPAYLVAFTVVLLFGFPRGAVIEGWHLPLHAGLLHNLVRGQEQAIYGASWTLSIELLFYLCVPLGAWLLRKAARKPISAPVLMGCVGVIWVLSIIWTYAVGEVSALHPVTVVWLRFLFPATLSMFCPGIIVAIAVVEWRRQGGPPKWFEAICTYRWLTLVAIVGLCALGGAGAYQLTDLQLYHFSRQAFAVAFGLVVMLAITRPDVKGTFGRVFAWLGIISYGLYLWHAAIRQIIFRHGVDGWVPMPHLGATAFFVHFAYLLALSIPVAWLSWVLIERPSIHWAKRHLLRRREAMPTAAPVTGA